MRLTSDNKCPICGKPRGCGYVHTKCSKILQKRAAGADERKGRKRDLNRYGKFVVGLGG